MESVIRCEYEYDKKVNFALQQNHVPVMKFLSIKNRSTEALKNVNIHITSNPNFSEPYSENLEELGAGEIVELKPNIILSSDYLSNLDESIAGHLHLKISSKQRIMYENHLPIDVLSYDSWPGASVVPEIITSFITPNRPFVQEIVKQAAEIMEKNTGNNALDGYQSGDPNRVIAQVSAIYSAIQSHQIIYANPPASFEQEGQKIRFPDMIKEHKLATCLDLTLLYAACAEAIGIYPMIVFLEGHAFPAFWLKEQSSAESFQDDKSILTKNMASGIHEIMAVESTFLTRKDSTFNSAVQQAGNSLDRSGNFHFFIDVRRSRIGQIRPISLKKAAKDKVEVVSNAEEPVNVNPTFAYDKVEVIPESNELSAEIQKQADKVTYWQNRLIDMSLRNNLINYRLHTQGIPVVTSDLAKTEDILAMGKKVFIKPLPTELRDQVRDFKDQQALLHSQILQEDMKNNRLRSTLSEAKLEKELVKLYRKAKNTLEESGANSLFVALGFLKWYDPKSYSTERFAPILLMPVDLIRVSAKKGYYIQARDEEIQVNISLIEYLSQKFEIDASRLYDIPKDDHGVDVKKVLTTMRRLVMHMKNWDVQEHASIGVFSFSKFVMWNDLVHHTEELKKNKVVKSLIDGNYIDEANESMTVPLTTEKDEEKTVYMPLSSDSTQTEAVLATGEGNSFVLHGPPGSGKSQTITNMISHALAMGKTVLFVAEKMAALRVVQSRLEDIGLGNFCLEMYSNKGQKKDILAQLETSFEHQYKTKGTNWSAKAEELKQLKKELNRYVLELHQPTSIGQSIFEMIETYSSLDKPMQEFDFNRNKVNEMDEAAFTKSKQLIENIAIVGEQCGRVQDNPWAFIKQTDYSLKLYDTIKEQLTAIEENAPNLREMEDPLAKVGLVNEDKKHPWYKFIDEVIPSLKALPSLNFTLLGIESFDKVKEKVAEVINSGQERDLDTEELMKRFDQSIVKLDSEAWLQELRLAENSWILKKVLGKSKVTKELKKYVTTKQKIDAKDLEKILTTIRRVQENQQKLDEHSEQMQQFFPDLWEDSKANWEEIEKAIEWADNIRTKVRMINDSPAYLAEFAQKLEDNKQALSDPEIIGEMDAYLDVYDDMMKKWKTLESELTVSEFHEPNQKNWSQFIEEKAAHLINALPLLKDSCHLARTIQEAEDFGLTHVTHSYLDGDVNHESLLPTYLYGFYRIRIDEEITSSGSLAHFTKAEFENKLQKFSDLDDEISELTKLEVYVKLMERVPDLMNNVIQTSEPGILMKAIKSKGRGIAIRQLFERISNLLPKLKPCMLMSPLSVAQYLDPSFPKFDLVIFDEASQLPTSEAIGAMARGENVIVVGDPKQLPPTSFFSAQQTEEDFDIQDLESVLDDCLSIRMPQKHLRWHYRSEHESLISFSNNHFYENKLITFPSIDDLVSRVSFKNVAGIYDRGKTKQNKIEAEAVVEEIFTRLNDPMRQQESIGVVTFSQVQQTLIEDMIDERLKDDPTLEKYFTDEVQEPVFVKNLENVQGDERDVILFTVGYGPDETGHMTLNFGPLNRDGGWRRLNVAVSRAKKEMIIFASMEPDKINLSRTKAEGVHSLRSFMEFAKRGNEAVLLQNRGSSQSKHNIIGSKIKAALEDHGYKIETNVGKSEFKVDLAVVDPKHDGQYMAAIQLDGPNYASRKTTRDRNKLTDLILGRLGWKIIKVWSIEWWHDEEKQMDNLLEQLNKIEANGDAPSKAANLVQTAEEKQEVSIQQKISSLIIPDDEVKDMHHYYEPVELVEVDVSNELFYTYQGLPIIQTQIERIVNEAAPVSFSQLTKSIINAWGFTRSGAKIEAVIHDALSSVKVHVTKEEKGVFIWKNEEQYKSYQDFRKHGTERRALQDISKVEYANGVMEMMETALRLPKADLIRELLKRLGYNRTSSQAEEFVQEAIELNVERGLVSEGEDGSVLVLVPSTI
ncbi:DUF3320 domain-containing protein [Aquibacillus albus]|uniref:Superfamily I DNA and/or RNA helicase n=1 Tax=Aquibacillus albus TaxID=1168171 RepID=A0ABS2N4H2_9BACI|nr:DUF3320 domain-containing protein [Aquibacillus albus]MBM7573021.1 superfamily I DNA and/or RNA helicase [Aquibacillus albus]